MFAWINWTRAVLVAVTLTLFVSPALATRQTTPSVATKTTERSHAATPDSAEEHHPAGSPELGILMIIGVVVFLILMAWLFSRVGGEGEPKAPDGSII
ncbi:MAG: hypothetical protein U0792_04685 [Gemmataceae bacterium]